MNLNLYGYQKVETSEYFNYDCLKCGACCRNVKCAVMIESFDLFQLAKFFNITTSEVCLRYTELALLAWGFQYYY